MILIIDLGTQSFRATVLDRAGRRVWEFSRPVETHRDGVIAEQDPRVWRAALQEALAGVDRDAIRVVAATATLSGLVCVGADDEPMRPAILYGDRRAAGQLAGIAASAEYQASPFRAYSGDFLPQLLYLQEAEPENFAGAKYLLDATGYLNYLLTGEATLDRYTTFTCYGDPTARFPRVGRIVEPGETIGRALGFPDARVVSVSYDSAAAYLGTRLAEAGEALDISGTVTSFGVLWDREIVDPARRVFSIPYGEKWLVRGSTAMSGGVLEWARGQLLGCTFEEFDAMVLGTPAGANGVTFLPFLAGARAPIWEPGATGTFHGLTAQTTRADLARAVYEGLCFSLRHIVVVMEALGVRVGEIQLGGGLSRNGLLNRMKADVLGSPVRAQLDMEVTTLGAATVAARAMGWLGSGESYCAVGEVYTPQVAYREAFSRYLEVLGRVIP
jgi:xylulokinase